VLSRPPQAPPPPPPPFGPLTVPSPSERPGPPLPPSPQKQLAQAQAQGAGRGMEGMDMANLNWDAAWETSEAGNSPRSPKVRRPEGGGGEW